MLMSIMKLGACLLLVALCACAGTPSEDPTNTARVSLQFSPQLYQVSTNDTLRLDVYREPDLSGEYLVDPSGTINIPLLGRVSVQGRTVQEIETMIAQNLARGYLIDPDVRISVIRYRPIFVSGEVEKPGAFPFVPGMTVQQAVVLAGGRTKFAANKYYLQRNNAADANRIRVEGNAVLFPGDVVTVGERLF